LVKAKAPKSREIISIHDAITSDVNVAPTLEEYHENTISHLEYTLRILGEDETQAYQRRWPSLPHGLQIRETHSPRNIQVTFLRASLCKEFLRKLKLKWIGLRFNPPLLL